MEHRCGERVAISLPATVHKADGDAIAVTIRNLSTGGAFVALPADRVVLRGIVELEFSLPGKDREDFIWRAWVIRQGAEGAGLMFDDRQQAIRRPLLASQGFLRRAQGVRWPRTASE